MFFRVIILDPQIKQHALSQHNGVVYWCCCVKHGLCVTSCLSLSSSLTHFQASLQLYHSHLSNLKTAACWAHWKSLLIIVDGSLDKWLLLKIRWLIGVCKWLLILLSLLIRIRPIPKGNSQSMPVHSQRVLARISQPVWHSNLDVAWHHLTTRESHQLLGAPSCSVVACCWFQHLPSRCLTSVTATGQCSSSMGSQALPQLTGGNLQSGRRQMGLLRSHRPEHPRATARSSRGWEVTVLTAAVVQLMMWQSQGVVCCCVWNDDYLAKAVSPLQVDRLYLNQSNHWCHFCNRECVSN